MNRLTLILAINDARDMGRIAARENQGWNSNPHPVGTCEWHTFCDAYNETLEQLAVAEMAMREGRKSDGEVDCDVAEPQTRGWFDWFTTLITGARG